MKKLAAFVALSLLMAVPEVTDQDRQDNPEKQPPAVLADVDEVMP